MNKKIILLIILLGISFSLSSCKQEEYPIELTKTMNEILEENDDWMCDSQGCHTDFETDVSVLSMILIVDGVDDVVIQKFGLASESFNSLSINYNYLLNIIRVHDSFDTNYDGTCKIIKDDMICDEGMPEFSDEAIEKIIEFKNYIDDIVEDYKK